MDALQRIRERGYLLRFENTDGWFVVSDNPVRNPVGEIWPDPDEIASDEAQTLIDAGLVKERASHSLDGTLVSVYTLTQQHPEGNGRKQRELLPHPAAH